MDVGARCLLVFFAAWLVGAVVCRLTVRWVESWR